MALATSPLRSKRFFVARSPGSAVDRMWVQPDSEAFRNTNPTNASPTPTFRADSSTCTTLMVRIESSSLKNRTPTTSPTTRNDRGVRTIVGVDVSPVPR